MKPFPKKTHHSAKTGRFVSAKTVARRKSTTVTVTSKCRQPSVKGVKRGRR